MGIHLNSSGGLTVSQRQHADLLGIPHEEFKKHIIARLIARKGGIPHVTRRDYMKKDIVQADKPVLIVGGGPSWRKQIEGIKKFSGTIIATEIIYNELASQGIIPDYITTMEENKRGITTDLFDPKHLKGSKSVVVGSAITRDHIAKHVSQYVKFLRFKFPESPRSSNCGIFSMCFAKQYLKADKLILVGMEHSGTKYPQVTYLTWQADFWYFAKQWAKETVVNCSDGGVLYHEDYIVDTTLDKLCLIPA